MTIWSLPAVATHNADEHSSNMELVATVPKAEAGVVNSDIAFWGNRAYAGYLGTGAAGATKGGFRIINITDPTNPALITDFTCAGSQNDVSVWNNDGDPQADLLFLSVDGPRTNDTCASSPSRVAPTFSTDPNEWEGVRIIDINNEAAPVQIAAVPTDCGSHTHTLVPGKGANADKLYIYVSSYPLGKAGVTTDLSGGLRNNGTECVEPEPAGPGVAGSGTGKAHNKISIITVDLTNPAAADNATGTPPNLTYPSVKEVVLDGATVWTHRTASDGFGGQRSYDFTACHDIAVFWEIDLAAGSCWREGQFWDITDPLTPDFLRRVRNDAEVDSLFHSATFVWDAKYVAFEDEAGGGGDDRCRDVNDPQGRILFYDISARKLGDFKIPRPQPKGQVCTAHNYNYVPQTSDRDILVSAWYQGGTSVADTTRPDKAKEIAFYEAHTPVPGGTTPIDSDVWSSYWYNGFIYANDEFRGTDIFRLNDPKVEKAITLPFLNVQTQMNLIPQTPAKCGSLAANEFGTSQSDILIGTAGRDVIAAGGGNDVITGLGGNDVVCGGAGEDKLKRGSGKDLLKGDAGNDRLSGGSGRDRCTGGKGKDRAKGCEKEKSIP
jgi:hypothetical protein